MTKEEKYWLNRKIINDILYKKCTSKQSLKYINEHWDGFIENVRRYIRNPKGKAAMKRNQIKQTEKGNRKNIDKIIQIK